MNLKNYLNVSSDKPIVPFIVGPTASGKSDLAIELAKEIDGEIISADSMQIYKEMDIGTAKMLEEEQQGIPHHMIDIISPDQDFSVADFYDQSTSILNKILAKGKTPIICGGTGLYINALSKPYNFEDSQTDESIRKELEELAQTEQGKEALYKELQHVDPLSAEIIHPNNIKRVIRALEIYKLTGKPKSVIDKEGQEKELEYTPVLISPYFEREILYDRINKRVDLMLEQGLLDEVKALDKKYGRNHTSMQAIGYKEFFDYLDNKQSLDESIRILKRDTRHFAKRQLTWFRRDDRINYLNQ